MLQAWLRNSCDYEPCVNFLWPGLGSKALEALPLVQGFELEAKCVEHEMHE